MKNYLSEMLYALTSAYTRKDYSNCQTEAPLETNIGKLFSILAWGLDLVQEQSARMKLQDNIDNASGTALDRYGANYGVKRIGPDDRYYRLAIKVKVMAQLSGGDINTVVWAAASLLEVETPDILLEEVFPAKIALYVDQSILSSECLDMIMPIAYAIKRILAAGIGMRLYLRTYRTYRQELRMNMFGTINMHITGLPAIQRKFNKTDLLMSQGALLSSQWLIGDSASAEQASRLGYRRGYYSTRIKPKRID